MPSAGESVDSSFRNRAPWFDTYDRVASVPTASPASSEALCLAGAPTPSTGSPSKGRKSRSHTFDLGSCVASVEAEHCASCHAEIHTQRTGSVVYGMDLKFCSEGCRCVLLHERMIDGENVDSVALVGKHAGFENPCMHGDMVCPHFGTLSAGLVKNKFENSPRNSPGLHGVQMGITATNDLSIRVPPDLRLTGPDDTAVASTLLPSKLPKSCSYDTPSVAM